MSYDLAVWEGDRPADDAEATQHFRNLYERFMADSLPPLPPTPTVAAFVERLLIRWPDISEDGGEDSPWSDAPLLGDASGSFIYFGFSGAASDEVIEFVRRACEDLSLTCYDPQQERMM